MRVIAGRLGSRGLVAPRGSATRPTTDRVREALFSILGDVSSLRVLDLYAGSGALGIEALSRGAFRATFVEAHSAALVALRRNLAALDLHEQASVVPVRVERARQRVIGGAPYDLVFCDPPWSELDSALEHTFALLAPDVLARGARVVVEHPARRPLAEAPSGPLQMGLSRRWGDTQVTLFVLEIAEKPRV
ncbi:MAG TPA: 16S rRNA (guanine(966)-N(2))-methyltransferase RsmD [Polyangiaceae bacterium]|nr:16S rRNA (guanine(966)-N(2))-methyltransferase RsmD [Polyangiaceae bacterium]